MNGVDMKNVPNAVWYCVTAVIISLMVAFVVLGVTGADATEFRSFLNTVLNFASVLLGGGAFAFAGAAAKQADTAAKQTNGILDQRIQHAITQALASQSVDSNAAVQTTYDKGVSDGRPTV